MMTNKRIFVLFAFLPVAALFSGCATPAPTKAPLPEPASPAVSAPDKVDNTTPPLPPSPSYESHHGVTVPKGNVNKNLIIHAPTVVVYFAGSLTDEQIDQPEMGAVCPLTDLYFPHVKAASPLSVSLVSMAIANVFVDQGYSVADPAEVKKVAAKYENYDATTAAFIGQELAAEVVIMGYLMRFEERGGLAGPASVAYSVAIIDPASGQIVWRGKYDKVQRPLLEDVTDYKTFFSGGMRWQTAVELAGTGAQQLLERAPLRPTLAAPVTKQQ